LGYQILLLVKIFFFFYNRLPELGVKNLEDVYHLEDLKIKALLGPDEAQRWLVARRTLPSDPSDLAELKEKVLIGSAQQAAWKWSNLSKTTL
jgi:hypothetical protein